MRPKFELGEEVYVKARIYAISLDKIVGDKALYSLKYKPSNGATIVLNYIEEDDLESVVQK